MKFNKTQETMFTWWKVQNNRKNYRWLLGKKYPYKTVLTYLIGEVEMQSPDLIIKEDLMRLKVVPKRYRSYQKDLYA